VTDQGAGSGALRVQRPESDTNSDTVSEGIGYGLLIAVYMNDRDLFDKLWGYWSNHTIPNAPLMHWRYDRNGNRTGDNSATDADEDTAFALVMASKQWGGSYETTARSVITAIWNNDIEGGQYVKGGSNFGGRNQTNPSYFAPAFYRVFDAYDSDTTHNWNNV